MKNPGCWHPLQPLPITDCTAAEPDARMHQEPGQVRRFVWYIISASTDRGFKATCARSHGVWADAEWQSGERIACAETDGATASARVM